MTYMIGEHRISLILSIESKSIYIQLKTPCACLRTLHYRIYVVVVLVQVILVHQYMGQPGMPGQEATFKMKWMKPIHSVYFTEKIAIDTKRFGRDKVWCSCPADCPLWWLCSQSSLAAPGVDLAICSTLSRNSKSALDVSAAIKRRDAGSLLITTLETLDTLELCQCSLKLRSWFEHRFAHLILAGHTWVLSGIDNQLLLNVAYGCT